MIHARVDVILLGHAKAYAAGPEAMGLWLFLTLAAREQETVGRVPMARALSAWGGQKNRALLTQLVAARLVEIEGDEVVVLNYAAKNETKVEIDARREAERAKKQRWRDGRNGAGTSRGVPPLSPGASLGVSTVDDTGDSPGCPGSGSDSLSGSGEEKIRSEERAAPAADPLASPPSWREDQVETVAMATGIRVEHVPTAWAQFVSHLGAEGRSVTAAEWQRWLTREARNQQRDAAKARSSPRGGRIVQRDPPGPPAPIGYLDETAPPGDLKHGS